MEGCFTFQWEWFVFQMRWEASFISGGVPHSGALVLVGRGCEKNRKMRGAHAPSIPPPPLWKTLCVDIELLLCMLSSAVHVLCMYVLFYQHY